MDVNKDAVRSANPAQKPGWFGTAGVAATATLIGFVIATVGYEWAERKQPAIDRETALTERLSQLSRDYYLVHELGEGKTNDVKQTLSFELAGIVRELHAGSNVADAAEQSFVDNLASHVLRDEKRHPEYYLASAPRGRVEEERSWAALQAEIPAKSPLP